MTPMKKIIKAVLTKGRSAMIELDAPISAESWFEAIRLDGSKFVYLNGTSYPKENSWAQSKCPNLVSDAPTWMAF
jgi:hypothetical protein